MTRSLLAGLALALGLVAAPAQAQNARVVATCGSGITIPAGDASGFFIDTTGRLCDGGGGGSPAAASAATGGVSNFSRIPSSAAGTNLTTAKASAGRAYVFQGCNTTASTLYLRLYNAASAAAVTVGTMPPFAGPYAFPANTCIPPTTFAANIGIFASAGITYAFGTAPADSDATAIGAGAITAFQLGVQ